MTIASDGGLKHGIGTMGWKIVSQNGTPLFSGSGPIDGPHDVANSTRSELGGITAPLLLCFVCIPGAILGHVTPVQVQMVDR